MGFFKKLFTGIGFAAGFLFFGCLSVIVYASRGRHKPCHRRSSFWNTLERILAQKRLRDRLKIYLQTLTPDEKGCYSLPYTRTELADFLCVDRSALSRELCLFWLL